VRHAWLHRPEILDYVIESYAGLDESPNGRGKRRVFVWEKDGEILMGNCEAFVLHLREKFDLVICISATSALHALLRDLGENAKKNHDTHEMHGQKAGTFTQPEPDEWVVGITETKCPRTTST
jgi:hypothetical protein